MMSFRKVSDELLNNQQIQSLSKPIQAIVSVCNESLSKLSIIIYRIANIARNFRSAYRRDYECDVSVFSFHNISTLIKPCPFKLFAASQSAIKTFTEVRNPNF